MAKLKKEAADHEGGFTKTVIVNFTEYYLPLEPWMNRLRKVAFPNGGGLERRIASCVCFSQRGKITRFWKRTRRSPNVNQNYAMIMIMG
jgi:hypothetical protein